MTHTAQRATGIEQALAAKQEFLVPCVYHFYESPPLVVRARGATLYDDQGKAYLDCYSGVTVMSAGHANPEITRAAIDQIETLQHTTTIYLTETIVQLAQALAGLAPGRLHKSFFCASGSEANEAAMLMACLHTGREHFIALENGLHGRTKWAMSATGIEMWRTDPHLLDTVHRAPAPRCRLCAQGLVHDECELGAVDRIDELVREIGPGRVAGVIVEPIQGNGGVIVPPDGYFQRLREICDEHGMLLIADEVQTGFNRTGRWFAMDHWDVAPDIMTVSKALGNGFPIAAAIATPEVADACRKPAASTGGGNPVACRAALATLDFHERAGLGLKARVLGAQLKDGLVGLAERFEAVTDVRGLGLMLGAELRDAHGEPATALADQVLELMKDAGFLIGKTGVGRNVLTFMPPLVVESTDLTRLVDALAEVLQKLAD
jgi:4-aminobutyrate aminotransferase-like enzyme